MGLLAMGSTDILLSYRTCRPRLDPLDAQHCFYPPMYERGLILCAQAGQLDAIKSNVAIRLAFIVHR
jgi:hypothetical protein